MIKIANAEFQCIEVWFTGQYNMPLTVEDLIIGNG